MEVEGLVSRGALSGGRESPPSPPSLPHKEEMPERRGSQPRDQCMISHVICA